LRAGYYRQPMGWEVIGGFLLLLIPDALGDSFLRGSCGSRRSGRSLRGRMHDGWGLL